jgi:hypothetical protein
MAEGDPIAEALVRISPIFDDFREVTLAKLRESRGTHRAHNPYRRGSFSRNRAGSDA